MEGGKVIDFFERILDEDWCFPHVALSWGASGSVCGRRWCQLSSKGSDSCDPLHGIRKFVDSIWVYDAISFAVVGGWTKVRFHKRSWETAAVQTRRRTSDTRFGGRSGTTLYEWKSQDLYSIVQSIWQQGISRTYTARQQSDIRRGIGRISLRRIESVVPYEQCSQKDLKL